MRKLNDSVLIRKNATYTNRLKNNAQQLQKNKQG